MSQFNGELKERLVRYCAIDSQSDIDSPTTPSTDCQHEMLDLMVAELKEIGASDVTKTHYGTVLATIPGNSDGPTIGFLAHVDTAPQFNATGVKPRVIEGYNGGDITYPDNPDLVLSPDDFPYLAQKGKSVSYNSRKVGWTMRKLISWKRSNISRRSAISTSLSKLTDHWLRTLACKAMMGLSFRHC